MKHNAHHPCALICAPRLTFLSLLVSTSLILGCTGSPNTVKLRDNLPTPPPKTGENSSTEKPGTPVPPPPSDGEAGKPIPTPTPTPAPAPAKVARFICESEAINTRSFNTLRGDVVSNYSMPSLIPYVDGQIGQYVKSPVPLQSNGKEVSFLLRAQENDLTPWKIYKATGNLLNSKANLEVLSNYSGVSPKGGYPFENLKLVRRILGANLKRKAFVYPADNGTYTWESLNGTKFELPFNADTAVNPTFVGDDDYLRFDLENEGVRTLTQKIYHFDSKKVLSLPGPVDSKDSQLFSFIDEQKSVVFWVEGRPEGTWKLRSMDISTGAEAKTLGTLPGNPSSIRLPIALLNSANGVLVAYNEEDVEFDKSNVPYLKTSSVHLIQASAKLGEITNRKSVPYSAELKRTAETPQSVKEGILGGLFFEPISQKLYAPVLSAGGLASFNLKSETWETHGMVGKPFGCLSPEWGIEVIHE